MKVIFTTEILASPEKVWYWLGSPERAMKWQTSVSKTEIIRQTPDWVGTVFRETIEDNGKSTTMEGVVTSYTGNKCLGMHITGQFNTVDVTWSIEEQHEHTRLTIDSNIRFKSIAGILSVILRPVFKRAIIRQLRRETAKLRELCESK